MTQGYPPRTGPPGLMANRRNLVREAREDLYPLICLLVDASLPGLAILSSRQTDGRRTELTKVVFDMSVSPDGFVKASNATPEQPLGDGGEGLHEWAFGEDERDREVPAGGVEGSGAIIAGRTTYDDSLPWWGADGPTGEARSRCSSSPTRRRQRAPREASITSSPMASRAPSNWRMTSPGTRTSP